MRARLVGLVLLATAGAAFAQDAPGFAGTWTINRELSQDLAAQINAVAGSAQMAGGPSTWATETWLPWKAGFSEGERLSVREFLLAAVPAFDSLEIQQGAVEVKTIHGEAGSRIFYLTRASAGTSAISGEKVTRQARLQGPQLVLESKGKEGRFDETFTLEPGGNRLVYVIRLDQKRLEKKLEARLVYDRAQ
jgi:hypothetical protein